MARRVLKRSRPPGCPFERIQGLRQYLTSPPSGLRIAATTTPPPTPLLDAALQRSEAGERVQHEAVSTGQAAVASPSGPVPPPVQTGMDVKPVQNPRAKSVSPATASMALSSPVHESPVHESSASSSSASSAPALSAPVSLGESKPEVKTESSDARPHLEVPRPLDEESDLVSAPIASEFADPKPEKPKDLAAIWAESIERLKSVARESTRQPGAGESTAMWLLRAQVVDWLADETLRPRKRPLLPEAVVKMAEATEVPTADASTRSAEIRSAALALEERVPLGINELHLCRKVLGFGSFESIDGAEGQDRTAGHPLLRTVRPALPDRGPGICFAAVVAGRAGHGQGRREGLGSIAGRGRRSLPEPSPRFLCELPNHTSLHAGSRRLSNPVDTERSCRPSDRLGRAYRDDPAVRAIQPGAQPSGRSRRGRTMSACPPCQTPGSA